MTIVPKAPKKSNVNDSSPGAVKWNFLLPFLRWHGLPIEHNFGALEFFDYFKLIFFFAFCFHFYLFIPFSSFLFINILEQTNIEIAKTRLKAQTYLWW